MRRKNKTPNIAACRCPAPGYWLCLRAMLLFALSLAMLVFMDGCARYNTPAPQQEVFDYKTTGFASYYAKKFHSRKTANGDIFNNNAMTAAHKTLPFGTNVMVKNVNNGKSVKVTINDRGPFIKTRIIDLTRAAFSKIENLNKGLTEVEISVVE